METIRLNNGVEMPILGYGVYQVTPEECERCVLMLLVSVIVLLIQHRHIIMKKEWVMQSGNAGYHVKNCLSPRKYGFRTVDTKKQKFLLTNLCVSSKVIMLICCLFISLSMITIVHTVPWKRLTRTEKLVPLASVISIRIVLSTWRNFVRLNRR